MPSELNIAGGKTAFAAIPVYDVSLSLNKGIIYASLNSLKHHTLTLDSMTGHELLVEFANIYNSECLIEFLSKWGFPDSTGDFLKDRKQPVNQLMDAIKSLQWVLQLIDDLTLLRGTEVSRETLRRIGQYLHSSPSPLEESNSIYITLRPTELDNPAWTGVKDINGCTIEPKSPSIPSYLLEKHKTVALEGIYRYYVSNIITRLVEDIQIELNIQLQAQFIAKTPYQAMSLALFEMASGVSAVKRCKNPHCPQPFFLHKGSGKRKPRSDRYYCDRPGCQKWCHENGYGVRKAKMQA